MTTLPLPQCLTCEHYRSPMDDRTRNGPSCAAFPRSIPAAIWGGLADHRAPYPGDGGTRWSPASGDAEFPRRFGMLGRRAAPDNSGAVAGDHEGAMVALVPTEEDARRLLVDGGEPADQLHLTLRYLGKAGDFSPPSMARLTGLVRDHTTGMGPVEGDLFSVALFNPGGDEPCVVGLVGGTGVWRAYRASEAAVQDYGADLLPEPHEPFVAHVTLEYTGDASRVAALTDRVGPVTFDRLRVAFGGERIDIPLATTPPHRFRSSSAAGPGDDQRSGLHRDAAFEARHPRDPGGRDGGQFVESFPGPDTGAAVGRIKRLLGERFGKVDADIDREGLHLTVDVKGAPVVIDLTPLDVASLALGLAAGGAVAAAKGAMLAGKVAKAAKLAKAAKAAEVGTGVAASVSRGWSREPDHWTRQPRSRAGRPDGLARARNTRAEWRQLRRADYYNIRWPKGAKTGGKGVGGRFKAVGAALEDWMNGYADDPLVGFSPAQLRAAAKRLGLDVPAGTEAPALRKALTNKALADVRAQRDENLAASGAGQGTPSTPPVGTRRDLPGGHMEREPSPGAGGEGRWSHDGTTWLPNDKAPSDVWAVYQHGNGETLGHVTLPSEARELLEETSRTGSRPIGTRLQMTSGANGVWDGQAWKVTVPRQEINGDVFVSKRVGSAASVDEAKDLAAKALAKRPRPIPKGGAFSTGGPVRPQYGGAKLAVRDGPPRKLTAKERVELAVADGRITAATAVRLLKGDLSATAREGDQVAKGRTVAFARALVTAGEAIELAQTGDVSRVRAFLRRQNPSTLLHVSRVFNVEPTKGIGKDGVVDLLVARVLADVDATKPKPPRKAARPKLTQSDILADSSLTPAQKRAKLRALGLPKEQIDALAPLDRRKKGPKPTPGPVQAARRRGSDHWKGQPRDQDGDDAGQWVKGPGGVLKDALRLADRIILDPGETFTGSDTVRGESGAVRLVATRVNGQPTVRLGVGTVEFGGREDEAGPWRGGRVDVSEINVERARQRAEYLELDALVDAGEATPEHLARFEELDESGAFEDVSPSGHAARLEGPTVERLRGELVAAIEKAELVKAADDARWAEIERLEAVAKDPDLHARREPLVAKYVAFEGSTLHPPVPGAPPLTDGEAADLDRLTERWLTAADRFDALTEEHEKDFGNYERSLTQGTIPGEWADIRFEVYVDDPSDGVQVVLAAVPHGVAEVPTDHLGEDAAARLDLAEARRLVRLLGRGIEAPRKSTVPPAAGPPGRGRLSRKFDPDQPRDPRTGEWVDTGGQTVAGLAEKFGAVVNTAGWGSGGGSVQVHGDKGDLTIVTAGADESGRVNAFHLPTDKEGDQLAEDVRDYADRYEEWVDLDPDDEDYAAPGSTGLVDFYYKNGILVGFTDAGDVVVRRYDGPAAGQAGQDIDPAKHEGFDVPAAEAHQLADALDDLSLESYELHVGTHDTQRAPDDEDDEDDARGYLTGALATDVTAATPDRPATLDPVRATITPGSHTVAEIEARLGRRLGASDAAGGRIVVHQTGGAVLLFGDDDAGPVEVFADMSYRDTVNLQRLVEHHGQAAEAFPDLTEDEVEETYGLRPEEFAPDDMVDYSTAGGDGDDGATVLWRVGFDRVGDVVVEHGEREPDGQFVARDRAEFGSDQWAALYGALDETQDTLNSRDAGEFDADEDDVLDQIRQSARARRAPSVRRVRGGGHWKDQPRDQDGDDAGQWIAGPASAPLSEAVADVLLALTTPAAAVLRDDGSITLTFDPDGDRDTLSMHAGDVGEMLHGLETQSGRGQSDDGVDEALVVETSGGDVHLTARADGLTIDWDSGDDVARLDLTGGDVESLADQLRAFEIDAAPRVLASTRVSEGLTLMLLDNDRVGATLGGSGVPEPVAFDGPQVVGLIEGLMTFAGRGRPSASPDDDVEVVDTYHAGPSLSMELWSDGTVGIGAAVAGGGGQTVEIQVPPEDVDATIAALAGLVGLARSWSRRASVRAGDVHPGGEALKKHWTKDPEGLAKWATTPHPWTSLYHHLLEHMGDEHLAKATASTWYHIVFGHWPGQHKRKFDPDQPRVPAGAPGGAGGRWADHSLGKMIAALYPDNATLLVDDLDLDHDRGTHASVFSSGEIVLSQDRAHRTDAPVPGRDVVVDYLDRNSAREVADLIFATLPDDEPEEEDPDETPAERETRLVDYDTAIDGNVVVGHNPDNDVIIGWSKQGVDEPDPDELERDFDVWVMSGSDADDVAHLLREAADRDEEAEDEEIDTDSLGPEWDLVRYADHSFGFTQGEQIDLVVNYPTLRRLREALANLRDAGVDQPGNESERTLAGFGLVVDADGGITLTERFRQGGGEVKFGAGTLGTVVEGIDAGLDGADWDGRRRLMPPDPEERAAHYGRTRRRGDRWKDQPRDPGGEDGGQWVKGPASAAKGLLDGGPDRLQAILNQAAERDDPRPELSALKVVDLKALLGHAGLPKAGNKADLVDRLAQHVTLDEERERPRPVAKKKATQTKAKGGTADDEPVRPHGHAALAHVQAEGLRDDQGPGGILLDPGDGDRVADRGPGKRPGRPGPGGPAVREPPGPADGGEADRGAGGAGGDAAAGRGGRGGDRGTVDAPVFRPRGQDDLAPATEKKRLAANIDALRTLRTTQLEDRPATAGEQAKLARWSGWGSLPGVFKQPPPDRAYAAAQAELKQLLSPAEFAAARRTTRNAHYTDAGYVRAIWDAMRGLGFEGGEVLEPGSGSGTFMGLVPEDISADTHVTGVELDPTTAAISRALYPTQDVRAESFADTKADDATFDAAIGNVPFSDTKLVDADHNPGRRHNMHNHFILKALRMTRPGGLAAFITSRYTMDSLSPDARQDMAKLGDLVGAVRLPSGAHERAAGTAVVTDLLIFRRRKPDTPYGGLPFEETSTVHVDGKDVAVNEFFVDDDGDPTDMVLGRLGASHGMRGKDDLTVKGDKDAEPALREALGKLVARAKTTGLTQTAGRRPPPRFARTGRAREPDGLLRANEDGTFTRLVRGVRQPYKVPATQADELRQLLRLRDTTLALVNAEAASADDTDETKRLRDSLNEIYDGYVADPRWGPVSRYTERRTTTSKGSDPDDVEEERVARVRPPQGGFRRDPFSAAVRSLEIYDPVSGTARKADIFDRRVIVPRVSRATADSPADALAITMDHVGEVDLEHLADLLDIDDEADARDALGTLVYDEPGTGRLVPSAEYLSGDVREKLAAARLAAAEDPTTYGANVEALERVVPPDLTPTEIRARMGAGWIGPKYVQQFLREILRDPTLTVRHLHGTDWDVASSRKNSSAATVEWGTRERSAVDLAEDVLKQRPIRVYVDKDVSQEKTEAAQAKANEIAARFEEWAWEDPGRQRDLQDTYNRQFNSLVLRSYDGGEMTLPGLARDGFYPYPHRYAAIRRIVAEPSVGLWHDVGAGKTSVMIIGAMEMRRLGLAQKPAIVVPNHMLDQMTREFLERYPQARVLGIGSDDLKNDKDGEKRREVVARAATGDWDAVILTQGAFKRIPVSTETEKDYLDAETEPLRRSVERRKAEAERATRARAEAEGLSEAETTRLVETALAGDRTVKELEGLVEKAEERAKDHLKKVDRDPGLSFEMTGIDYLFVDEAHTYKNLHTASSAPSLGIPGSQIATDLHMKLHYLRSRNDRVATLATATPIANSVTEAYTMLRYLRPDLLQAMGVDTFDDFAAQFGEIVTRLEVAPTGGLRQHSRFAKFVNLPELLRPWLVASDVKTAEDLKDIVKVPDLVERVDADGRRTRSPETVVVPPSEELKDLMATLVRRAKSIQYPPRKGADNMLRITGEGRAAALDLQMVGRQTDEPTKLDVAADRIAGIYEDNKDRVYTGRDGAPVGAPGALQLVFSDIGTPGKKRKKKSVGGGAGSETFEELAGEGLAEFSAYEALRDKLEARGVPRSKVRFIHEANTDQDKAELFAASRDGRVAVLVGSTSKMGVGTNVQDRAVALHHLDAPWRPADVQQREGRIVRQGNKNSEVQVIRYVTEQSFDAYVWQAITTKGTFINQIMRGRLDVREMEDVGEFSLSAAEVTALGTGNRWLIEHTDARADLTRLERAQRNHEADQRNLARQISANEAAIPVSERLVTEFDDAIARRTDTRGAAFRMSLLGTEHTSRADAQDGLRRVLKRVARGEEETDPTIGAIGGFPIRAHSTDYGVTVDLLGVPGSSITVGRSEMDSGDIIGKLQNTLDNLEKVRARHVARKQQARQDIEALRSRLGKPFRDADALEAARARFERVTAALTAELARRGESDETPEDPAAKAAARRAAAIVEIRDRLDSGQGGFRGIGELTTWLEADPELADRIPADAGAKWGVLSPRGLLVVRKEPAGRYGISVARTMRTSRSTAGFRTQADAKRFAAILDDSGVPWGRSAADLAAWRAPDGAPADELVARLRGESRALDPTGEWKDAAARALVARRTPERLREPLLEGLYRRDGLGVVAFAGLPPRHRDEILAMLQDAADPGRDLATAARLREYGLDQFRPQDDASSYAAMAVAVAAAQRLEQDHRDLNPQPLDHVRRRFRDELDGLGVEGRARVDQILNEADASGDLDAAAADLRALADERLADEYVDYRRRREADVARSLADVLAARDGQAAELGLVGARSLLDALSFTRGQAGRQPAPLLRRSYMAAPPVPVVAPDAYARLAGLPDHLLRRAAGPGPGGGRVRPNTVRAAAAQAVLDAFDARHQALDDDSRALCLALAELDGRRLDGGERAWDPGLHPRWPKGHPAGGKFRPTVGALIGAVTAWQKGDRESDPFEGFSAAQLKKVAKAREVDVRPGAGRDEVAKHLLDDLESREVAPRRPQGVDATSWDTLRALARGEPTTVKAQELPGLMDAIATVKPPPFNLARLKVDGAGNENLFQRHLSDQKRKTMPQLPTETGPDLDRFENFLRDSGIRWAYGHTDPRNLVATQSELSGPKVAKLYGFMRDDGWKKGGVLIMSRDGAVIDGHHRWAGAAGASVARGGTLEVDTMVLDLDWQDALRAVAPFATFEDLATDREGGKGDA